MRWLQYFAVWENKTTVNSKSWSPTTARRRDTADVVKRAQATLPVPLTHVWQEDTGFRLAAVRNRATARAARRLSDLSGRRLHRASALRARSPRSGGDRLVRDRRARVAERSFHARVLANGIAIEDWSVAGAAIAAVQGKLNRAMSLPRLPLGPLRKLGARRWQRLRGCNFSAFRADIERVNGFDECFQGWGLRTPTSPRG